MRATGIERDLAAPTTFLIDRAGMVRYCYQGRDLSDRPTVPALLEALDRMAADD